MNKVIILLLISTLFSSSHRCPETEERDERPVLETYYQSPQGHFFIHYDTSGEDAPSQADLDDSGVPDYVEQAALAADSSRYILTEVMGFITEADDVDGKYDIYIKELGNNLWGVTQYETEGSSFIKIRNNYDGMSNFCSDSNELLWLTVGHEFFHAIQYTYKPSSSDSYFREMTSMWFENVFVENCYDFLDFTDMSSSSLFNNPEGYFDGNQSGSYGYSLALYGHYLSTIVDPDGINAEDQLNTTIIKKIWEHYAEHSDVLSTIEYVLNTQYEVLFYNTWADFMSRNMFAGQSSSDIFYHPGLSLIDPPEIDFHYIKGDSEVLTETISTDNYRVKFLGYTADDNLRFESNFYLEDLDHDYVLWYGNLSSEIYRENISENDSYTTPVFEESDRMFYVISSQWQDEFQIITDVVGYGCTDHYADNFNASAEVDDDSCVYSSSVRSLFPNPVDLSSSSLYINYVNEGEQDATYKVIDTKGRVLLSKTVSGLSPGYNLIEISDLRSISSGLYYLSINDTAVSKFINVK